MSTVKIGGADIDADDPCALYQALYAVKLKRLAGEAVEEVQVQSPASRRMIRAATIPMAELNLELNRLASACEAKNGKTRRRFAAGLRF